MTGIPGRFTARASAQPDRTAVSDGRTSLTYRELDTLSQRLAQALVAAGVRPGDRVGVCLPRSAPMVVALLAVLRAGAAYVPLDPAQPAARLALLAQDTGVGVVVGDEVPSALAQLRRVAPSEAPGEEAGSLPADDPDRVAYVIHTSGSTGRPKGVLVTHRNVLALIDATTDLFGLGAQDVWSLFHSIAFDVSVWEIWGCLLNGGRLVVVPHWTARDPLEFRRLLVTEQVTVLNQTPSAFTQLLTQEWHAEDLLPVRLLIFAGETLDATILRPWVDRYPRQRIVNMYGITETTVHCTWQDIGPAETRQATRSVGRALPGWQLYVLDGDRRPVGAGTIGEIHVGGAGLAVGYLDRPELTAERFLDQHRVPGAGRLYRSGDRGRFLPDGRLEHLGRYDDQVQVRGHRVEVGEVRSALLADDRVAAAAVLPAEASAGPVTGLVAYVVTPVPGEVAEIRRDLARRVPDYMVPDTLTVVPELPLTLNGKLDAARLRGWRARAPEPGAVAVAVGIAPAITHVLSVSEQILGVPVRPGDNFFELGGNSMRAARLVDALRAAGFATVAVRDVYLNSTLAALAGRLDDRLARG